MENLTAGNYHDGRSIDISLVWAPALRVLEHFLVKPLWDDGGGHANFCTSKKLFGRPKILLGCPKNVLGVPKNFVDVQNPTLIEGFRVLLGNGTSG